MTIPNFIFINVVLFFISCSEGDVSTDNTNGNDPAISYPIIEESCDDFATLSYERFTIENNTWGSSRTNGETYEQCISIAEIEEDVFNIGWSWQWPMGSGGVKAYPEIYFGSKFGSQSDINSGLPARANQIQEYTITFAYQEMLTAIHQERNIAFESWFHTSDNISFDNVEYELMVWLDKTENFYPGGSYVTDITLDNVEYEFFMGDFPEWIYFAFVRKESITAGSLRWNSFVEYLIEENHLNPNSYMADIEFGTEIIEGEGTFTITEFDININ